MRRSIYALGSLRLTLAAAVALAAGVWQVYPGDGPVWLLGLALALLAVNLACALVRYPRLRHEPGLLLLHVSLLASLCLVAGGWLTRLEAHVELVDGQRFADAPLQVDRRGPLHPDRLDRVQFMQTYYTVDYAPGVQRSDTRSRLMVDGEVRMVGDHVPLVLEGYRFYSTHNKGYALVLDWTPTGGRARRGTVNMPSYPANDWMQENRFVPPGGATIALKFKPVSPVRPDAPWQLDSRQGRGDLEVRAGERVVALGLGQAAELPGGTLRFVEVRGWMGYRVYYDPTLPWLFWSGVAVAAGLAWHLLAARARPAARREAGAVGHAA